MIHIILSGNVQGVGFRQFIRYQARKLNIKGWVRNLPDGSVEAVFVGSSENVKKMINFSKRKPVLADVKSMDVEEVVDKEFKSFEILK